MRTLQLDGSGNKNQDRSISPSAIVGALPPFALAPPTPTPRPTPPPAAPGGGGGGRPPGAGAPGPGWPSVTVPPTSTETMPGVARADAAVATLLATISVGLLATLPALRRRRR
jgi:hypothetical protein